MNTNPASRTMVAWIIVTCLAVLAIFAPSFLGIDGFGGGFAISVIAFLVAITGIIVVFIYAGRAKNLGRILRGEGVIAHWTYSPEEWKAYAEKEYSLEKGEKKSLFILVAAIALVMGIGFFVFNPESGGWVLLSMVALVGVIAFTAWFSAWCRHRENTRYHGEAYITGQSVYLNRQLHTWSGPGEKFGSMEIANIDGRNILVIGYTVWTRNGRTPVTVRVPVPAGKEKEAEAIAAGMKLKP
jgi:hypothetical protein